MKVFISLAAQLSKQVNCLFLTRFLLRVVEVLVGVTLITNRPEADVDVPMGGKSSIEGFNQVRLDPLVSELLFDITWQRGEENYC